MRIWSWFVAWRINRKYKNKYAGEFDTFFTGLLEEMHNYPLSLCYKD